MVSIDIDYDISELPVLSRKRAEQRIESENDARSDRSAAAIAGGESIDFRYIGPKWHLLETDKGTFVATIESCGGGGRVDPKDPSRNFSDAYINYGLHALVED